MTFLMCWKLRALPDCPAYSLFISGGASCHNNRHRAWHCVILNSNNHNGDKKSFIVLLTVWQPAYNGEVRAVVSCEMRRKVNFLAVALSYDSYALLLHKHHITSFVYDSSSSK